MNKIISTILFSIFLFSTLTFGQINNYDCPYLSSVPPAVPNAVYTGVSLTVKQCGDSLQTCNPYTLAADLAVNVGEQPVSVFLTPQHGRNAYFVFTGTELCVRNSHYTNTVNCGVANVLECVQECIPVGSLSKNVKYQTAFGNGCSVNWNDYMMLSWKTLPELGNNGTTGSTSKNSTTGSTTGSLTTGGDTSKNSTTGGTTGSLTTGGSTSKNSTTGGTTGSLTTGGSTSRNSTTGGTTGSLTTGNSTGSTGAISTGSTGGSSGNSTTSGDSSSSGPFTTGSSSGSSGNSTTGSSSGSGNSTTTRGSSGNSTSSGTSSGGTGTGAYVPPVNVVPIETNSSSFLAASIFINFIIVLIICLL